MPGFLPSLLVLLLATVGALRAAEPAVHLVLPPVVNLFSGPSEDLDVVSQALCGARLLELDRNGGWLRIQAEDAYKGWVRADLLRSLGTGERYPAEGREIEVDALAANLYREPDVTRHAPVLTAPYGVRLERLARGKDTARWLEVRLPDRREAWIQAGDIRTEPRPLGLQASLALARRFLGITYTWGGTSTFGFDCSGFTQAILRSRGLLMPRDAKDQAAWPGLAEVPRREELKPGDLLFFGRDLARVNHTGMYLGEGKFIHDTPKDRPGVQVSDLADPTWSKALVAMRRVK